MAALTAHFDDSGTHGDSHTIVVAGFVSLPVQWRRFTREWNKAKSEYGFQVFRFAEFLANAEGSEFEDKKKWSDRYKAIVLRSLREIAFRHSIQAFSASVGRADYEEIVVGHLRERFGSPFTWVVRSVMGFIEKWRAGNDISEPIEYIFDTMHDLPKREIDGIFDGALKGDDVLQRYGIHPGCHSFGDEREILPLQAADLLAGCVYQRDKVRVKGIEIPQYVADTFNFFKLKDRYFISRYQTRESLLQMMNRDPHLIHPEDRRPKPTPKGTKPNPSKKKPRSE